MNVPLLQFLPWQQHWPNMTAGLWFMTSAAKQSHLQHNLLNTWAHLEGSLGTGKLKEVIIASLSETPSAARTHLLLSENILQVRNYSWTLKSSEEPRLCYCELLIFLWEVTTLQGIAMFLWGKEGGGHNQEKLTLSPVLLVFVRLLFSSHAEMMCRWQGIPGE